MAENDLEERPRRRRYQKVDSEGCLLTPKKQGLLLYLSECRLLSLPQLATLGNLTQRAARKHLRPMFDGGLVSVVAVPRSVLAEQDDPNDDSLLYGSAPNIYTPTREGLRYLYALGKIDRDERDRPIPVYGPRNALFLAHELQVRDMRIFLETARRRREGELLAWRSGSEAAIEIATGGTRNVRPDTWFCFRMTSGNTLVGLVEIDRGTERGDARWKEKAAHYSALLTGGQSALAAATGFKSARILVVVPTAARQKWLASRLAELVADPIVCRQFWLTTRPRLLEVDGFTAPIWQQVGGSATDLPLLPKEMVTSG